MPKAIRSSNHPEATGTVDPPAKAPSAAKKKKDKQAATDPSTWPESKIDATEKITLGDIKQYYHLTPAVYSALSRSSYRTGAGFTAYLYNEREVERAAWTKYGSPEGYEAHLEDLRQRQAIQNPQKPFLTPSLRKKSKSRLTPFEIKINTMYDSWRTGPTGVWKLDSLPPILQIVKDRFPTELEWLWRRCNEALDPRDDSIDMTPAERAKVLGLVLVSPRRGALTPYPLRPSGSLGSSESVDELRAILARAPECRGKDGEIAGMVRHETCHPEWDVWYDWDGDYYDEVFQALMEVVKQHGVGDEGWASARWEVYDTYAECVSGISYNNYKGEWWGDGAKLWLDASMTGGCKLGKELKAVVEGRKVESNGTG